MPFSSCLQPSKGRIQRWGQRDRTLSFLGLGDLTGTASAVFAGAIAMCYSCSFASWNWPPTVDAR